MKRRVAAAAPRPAIGRLRPPKSPAVLDEQRAGGLRLLAVRRPTIPMVQLRLSVPLPPSEIARAADSIVLSESLLSGTAAHDRAGLAAAVERLGGDLGASHDTDRFVLGGSVLAEHLAELLDLVSEVLVGATFLPSEVRADRARVADETLIALSQPGVTVAEALRRRMYPGHPAAAGLPTPATLRRVTPAALHALHRSVLAPGSAQLVVVGDLDTARIAGLVEEHLGPWLARSCEPPATDLPPLPALRAGPLELVDRPGSVQSNIAVGAAAPRRTDPGWPAASLANLVYGGLFASRLVLNLRERHGYSYSPRSSITHARAGSALVVRADVASEATAASLLELRYELARTATAGVEDGELESARSYALGSLALLTSTQAGLAATLSSLVAVGAGPGYLASHAAGLARATKEDVDEAARRLFAAPTMATVVVGDAEAVAGPLGALDTVAVRSDAGRAGVRS